MTDYFQVITLFGDSLILLPASTLLYIYIVRCDSAKRASLWIVSLLWCLICVAAAKILGYGAGAITGGQAISLSGHTAFSILFYISASLAVMPRAPFWGRVPLIVLAAGIAGLVGFSRLELSAHTSLEVALGAGVGLFFVGYFAWGRTASVPPSKKHVTASFCFLLFLSIGRFIANEKDVNLETIVQVIGSNISDTVKSLVY